MFELDEEEFVLDEDDEEDDFFIPGEDCDLSGSDMRFCLHCDFWGGDGICFLAWEEDEEEED